MTNPELNEQMREEAEKFNRLHKGGRVSGEYLSVLPADQSPEETERIIESAERRMQDVNSFGVLAHGSRSLDKDTFVSILTGGLKSKKQLAKEGKDKMGSNLGFGLYPDAVSFEMSGAWDEKGKLEYNSASQYGVRPHNPSWQGDEDKEKERYLNSPKSDSKWVDCTFIANPEYIRRKIEQDVKLNETGLFITGTRLASEDNEEPFGDNQKKIIDYAKKVGWLDAAKDKAPNPSKFLDDYSFPNYDAHHGEVVLYDRDEDANISEPMLSGVVVRPENSTQVIGWLNEIAKTNPEKVVPVYNIYGDLIWPVNMPNEKVKEFIEKKEQKDG
jgi:hypothetical protein